MASTINIPDMVEENANGIFATQPIRASLPVLVAPTDSSRAAATNLIRRPLVVVACANLKEYNFDFDSSVVLPQARDGFTSLAGLIGRHPGSPMSMFGHTDPEGPVEYNQFLSERRARAIFAVLVRDPAIWDDLFRHQQGASGDDWAKHGAIEIMLTGLGLQPGEPTPGLAPETRDALRQLLGLPPGASVNNAAVRLALFERYMDFLRSGSDGKATFPAVTTDDFLGKGKQRGTLQGCSKFNPQLLLKKQDQDRFDKDKSPETKQARDLKNENNRRVVIYFFAPGSAIDPERWPCPTAQMGPGRCEARQWSDGTDRRKKLFVVHPRRFGREVRPEARELDPRSPVLEQKLGNEETTFGCRFYHGIAAHSPCERDLKMWGLRILIDAPTPIQSGGTNKSNKKIPLANRRYVALIGSSSDAPSVRGRTTAEGMIGLPFFDPNVPITLKIDAFAALAPPPAPAKPGDPAPAAKPTSDSERFEDEDQFLVLRLDGSKLRPIRVRDESSLGFDPDFDDDPAPVTDADRRLGALQRLFNLGYGSDDTGGDAFGNWTNDQRRAFLKQFQRDHDLDESGTLDQATTDALIKAHGS